MTSSAAPQGEDAGLEQEGIWEDASGTKDPDLPRGPSVDAGGLTQNLTSEVFRNLAIVVQFAQSLSNSVQLFFEQQKYLTLDCVRCDQVVDLGRVLLAVTVDTSDSLLQVHGVPRQVVIE